MVQMMRRERPSGGESSGSGLIPCFFFELISRHFLVFQEYLDLCVFVVEPITVFFFQNVSSTFMTRFFTISFYNANR